MKTKQLITGTLLSAILLGVSACAGTEVQGRLQSSTAPQVPTTPAFLAQLSPASPSGARAVSAADEFFLVDLSATYADITLPAGTKIRVGLISTTTDIDTDAEDSIITLKSGGTVIGTGDLQMLDIAPEENRDAHAFVVLTNDLTIPKSTTVTLTFSGDTTEIMDEEAGEDDILTADFSLTYGTEKFTVMGNTLQY